MTATTSTSLTMTVERALRISSSRHCSVGPFESLKVVPYWTSASIVVMVRNARMPSETFSAFKGKVAFADLPFFFEGVASGGEEIAFVELPLLFEGVNMSCTVKPIWV